MGSKLKRKSHMLMADGGGEKWEHFLRSCRNSFIGIGILPKCLFAHEPNSNKLF